MKPLPSTPGTVDTIRSAAAKLFRLASLGIASMALCQALHAADLLNGGFDTAASNQANNWSSTGSPAGALPGTIRGGTSGGNGWTTAYFGGAYPTDSTFASTVAGPVRQNISGAGNTFVEGVTYTLSMKIFGSSTYALGANIMWSLGLTADGVVVKRDHWFSEEFNASRVSAGNGGTIPDDHITTVASGSTGLKTVLLTYTATAADAGKVIGVQLGGDTQTLYTLASGAPAADDYYGMLDTVTFNVGGPAPVVLSFASDIDLISGQPITLSWNIENPGSIQTLTLNDGTGAVDIKPDTDSVTGLGSRQFTPTANTTYTLTLNGTTIRTVNVVTAKITSFTSNVPMVAAPDYKVTLNWNVQPLENAAVTISDGATTIDVTTDTVNGIGSREFVVPNPSTTYTLNVKNGGAIKTLRVLRPVASNPDKFGINLTTVYSGETLTVSWKDTVNASGSWVAVYRATDLPGGPYAVQWKYITNYGGATGSYSFTGLAPGQYFAVLFADDGYTIEQGPILFTVTSAVRAPFVITAFLRSDDMCSFTWNSEAGASYDIFASDSLGNWESIETGYASQGYTTSYAEDLRQLPDGVPLKRFYRVAKSVAP